MPSFHLEFEKVSPLEIRILISVQKRSLVKTIVCDLLGHDKESVWLPLQKKIKAHFLDI